MVHDEDCHFLNIYTPSVSGARPVLVWIHGGAFIAGSGEEAAYDGRMLSEEGDMVGDTPYAEWLSRGQALRRQWIEFVR